jgi:ubiquitin-conjugating enzyme E2 W
MDSFACQFFMIVILLLILEWSPALTVSSICLSVLSMLSSAPKKVKPFNDAEFVKRAAGRGPKAFLWSYDDDKA